MKALVAAALVNFLWQGVAIGALAWIGFRLTRTPRVRYIIGILALALMAASPIVTGSRVAKAATGRSKTATHLPTAPAEGRGEVVTYFRALDFEGAAGTGPEFLAIPPIDERAASAVLVFWILGVTVLSSRLGVSWLGVRRLTRHVSAAGADVKRVASQLVVALRVRATVRVVESTLVRVPAVIGAFKPVVLLPAAAMSGLSIAQVEAVLAHELAHVRRHDYLMNLLQSIVETLLFYQPAVWLVSRRVRRERELCCDDLALEVCGDRVTYASALADLESMRATPSPAVGATGGSLLDRIRRILGGEEASALSGRSRSVVGIVILASIVALLGTQVARAGGTQTIAELASSAAPPLTTVFPATRPASGELPSFAPPPRSADSNEAVSGSVAGKLKPRVAAESVVAPIQSQEPKATVLEAGNVLRLEVKSGEALLQTLSGQLLVIGGDGSAVVPGLTKPITLAGQAMPGAASLIEHALVEGGIVKAPHVSFTGWYRDISSAPARGQQQTGLLISVGQVVRLEVAVGQVRQSEFNKEYTVQPDGTILVPYLGATQAAGFTARDLGTSIENDLNAKGILPGARVAISIEARTPPPVPPAPPKSIFVTVQGAVRTPGRVPLLGLRNTLTDAIAAAGGLQSRAGARIFVKRPGTVDQTFSKVALLEGTLTNSALRDGDLVTVEVASHFYVSGYVKSPTSEYNWEPGMTLAKAIALAGGINAEGAGNRIQVRRKDPTTRKFVDVKLDKDRMSTPIEPDDVISVPRKRM